MEQQQTTYQNAVPGMGWMFRWIERHPRLTNAILIAEGIALIWAVWNYRFTTHL